MGGSSAGSGPHPSIAEWFAAKLGRNGVSPTVIHETKLWDKNRATEQLLKSPGTLSERGPVTVNQTTVNAGPGALEQTRMCELENQLRAVLGQDRLPVCEVDDTSVAELIEPNEDIIEAAQ